MGIPYPDDRMTKRQDLESRHQSVFYATEEVDLLNDWFHAAVALINEAANVDEAIKKLKDVGEGAAEIIEWLTKQNGTQPVSAGTIRYTIRVRYRNGPVQTGWQVKGYRIQGWVAVD
ncbi:unnamed protein product [Absidia cylindrospora]